MRPIPRASKTGKDFQQIRDCRIDPTAQISNFVNLYECRIGKKVFVGPFVEIQRGAVIGDYSRISSHSFVCEGVTIGKNCFIAHGTMFTNDKYDSKPNRARRYIQRKTVVGDYARIGSNATLLPVKVGHHAIIGAGAVVTRDVPPRAVVAGNPARILRTKKV